MAEPIAALIVRILADTSEMVSGVKKATDQLSTFENRVSQIGKALAGYFTVDAIAGFVKSIVADIEQIDAAAKRLGTTSEEFQRFSYAVKQSGGDAQNAAQAILSLTDKLGSGDTGLFNVLRKLNINVDEFKQKDAVSRFVELATAINGVVDPTQQLQLKLEALGPKGVASLTAVNDEFKKLADNAPVYTDAQIAAVKRAADAWDDFVMRVKIGAAGAIDAAKEVHHWMSMGAFGDAVNTTLLRNPDVPTAPKGPGRALPAALASAPLDPNNTKELAVAEADLALKAVQAAAALREEKEAFDSTNAVLKLLKMELTSVAGAMEPFLKAFDTSTKVENMTKRILDLTMKTAALRKEQEDLMKIISPTSDPNMGLDEINQKIFELRSDPNNFQNGNLTAQALTYEHELINTANLRSLVPKFQPPAPSSLPTVVNGSNIPGFASVMNPPAQVTIDARGAFLSNPDSMNQLGRLMEDILARRGLLNGSYSRR